MVRMQSQLRNDYARAIQQIGRSQKTIQSIIADVTIDVIRTKALKYRVIQKKTQSDKVDPLSERHERTQELLQK